jgi:hypothetical protein
MSVTLISVTKNAAPPVAVDVVGVRDIDVQTVYGDVVNVNLEAGSEWVGGFNLGPGSRVNVQGSGQFYNQSSHVNGTAIIGVPVIGTGVFNVYEAHSLGKLEFMRSVSAGQHIADSGYELYGGQFGIVQVDNPATFHASVTLGFGEVILEGLKASSYSLKNDLLTLYHNGAVVDAMRMDLQTINGSAPVAFGVSQTASGVVVHADGASYHDGGTLLPIHA